MRPHFGHVLLVLRGSTGIIGTPASFALYSINPRNSANDHFDILSRSGLPEPSPFADAGQVFKTDPAFGVCSFLNDPLRDAMIFVRLKPAFLAGESLQFSLDVLRALAPSFYFPGLPPQRTSDLISLLAYFFSFGVGIDIAVIVGGEIDHAEIHADELRRSYLGSFGHVHSNEQKPLAVLTAHDVAFSFCQAESLALIFANNKRDDQASLQ